MTDKELIPVNKLVEKVTKQNYELNKSGKVPNNRRSRLKKILASRKVKRESWTSEKRQNYEQFLLRLKEAHDNYVSALESKIVECAENILKRNLKNKTFKLWDPQNIKCDIKNFSEFTIFRGFWNSEKKKHDRLPHMEAGIKATPLVQVSRELRPLGYIIKDISNTSLSLHVVVEVLLELEEVQEPAPEVPAAETETKLAAPAPAPVAAPEVPAAADTETELAAADPVAAPKVPVAAETETELAAAEDTGAAAEVDPVVEQIEADVEDTGAAADPVVEQIEADTGDVGEATDSQGNDTDESENCS